MPNGGSDCCGTCWFNSKNKGEAGYQETKNDGEVKCIIRNIEISNPFWTYCGNHPHHNRDRIDLPLGPVYINDGYPYSRKVWKQPPDSEEVRQKLLSLLDDISNISTKYPSYINLEEEIIKQVSALKESRALPKLLKIIQLNFDTKNKAVIVGQAIEALLEISQGQYLAEVKHFIDYGVEKNYQQDTDKVAAIRYHLIRGLQYCKQPEANELLQIGINDPHNEVKAFAIEITEKKQNNS